MLGIILQIIIAVIALVVLNIIFKIKNRPPSLDIFRLWGMTTQYKCSKCGALYGRPFKRFEYIGMKLKACHGKAEITGIFHVRLPTKNELKWLEFEEEWYTDGQREQHVHLGQ